jgi:hypothetical protein
MAKRVGVFTPILLCALLVLVHSATYGFAEPPAPQEGPFPRSLQSYEEVDGIWSTLGARVHAEPFNLVATLIFLLAIVHTFLTSRFLRISHRWSQDHERRIERGEASRDSVPHGAKLMHLLGEVEVVFGLWAVALMIAIVAFYGFGTAIHYLGETVDYTEAAFVVVIMTLAATRPILRLAEGIINRIAGMLGGSLSARWFTTLTVGALLGSFITEPAAITISALVLGRTFYALEPSAKFKYATLGLLLVNVSVGGTLTNFAAPPVLMVAGPWGWGMGHMLLHFGWKAAVGILVSNGLYFALFRRELMALEGKYAVVRLKEEIQTRYLRREDVDARFDQVRRSFSAVCQTRDHLKVEIQDLLDRVRTELENEFVPELRARGIDEDLIREAFAQRFEEIRLREMRRLVPALLPADQRGPFVDPDWDNRDDPVPGWVTLVHVLFMVWAIVNAHHPPLFILGMLFFLGFAAVSSDYQNRIDLRPAMLVGFFLAGLVIHGGVQGWWIEPILGNLGEIPLMAVATVLTAFNDNAAITYLATLVPGFSDFDKGVSPVGLLGAALAPTTIMFLLFLLTR